MIRLGAFAAVSALVLEHASWEPTRVAAVVGVLVLGFWPEEWR